jgi:hypothetical protein
MNATNSNRKCLACGYVMEIAVTHDGSAPKPNEAVLICGSCGHLMMFGDDGMPRELNDAEMIDVAGDPTLLRMQELRAKAKEEFKVRETKPPTEPIRNLFVWLSVQPDGAEGIIAEHTEDGGAIPMLTSVHSDLLLQRAQQIAEQLNKPMRVVRFARIETIETFGEAPDIATEHTYPSKYPPGTRWDTDAAWEILDFLKPGVISEDNRAMLGGLIAGRLNRERALAAEIAERPEHDWTGKAIARKIRDQTT